LVAGGGELISAGHIPNCQSKIHNTAFTHTCNMYKLQKANRDLKPESTAWPPHEPK
jgi:hypothetical protein